MTQTTEQPMLRWDQSSAVEQAVEELLAQLTLEDKINLVSGKLAIADDGTVPALPEGMPLLAIADGPPGLRLANPTLPDHRATALPAPLALAATWDPELARRYGSILGAEAAATGHSILLAPAVDIARAPWAGRTFESFGEDPLLQSRLAVPEVQAIQAQGVLACVKHYIANNQEHSRSTIDVRVDEQALQEIYLPPFAAAIRDGGAAAVMGSYNRINGVYACENPHVLTDILRDQLAFRGFVMSDFYATHSTREAAEAGLDWELGTRMWGEKLLEAVKAGSVAAATVDEMVRRILRPVLGLGLREHPRQVRPFPAAEHSAAARAIAEQAMVLLKNEGGVLPLAAGALRSLAVIGPDADNISAAGGGSGFVQPTLAVSVLDGLRERAGAGVEVEYAPGVDPVGTGALLPGLPAIPSACFATGADAAPGSGLQVEYWSNPNFAGEPHAARVERRAELCFGFNDIFQELSAASPKLPKKPQGLQGPISVRWRGLLHAPASGEYELGLTCLGTARVLLDGQLVVDSAAAQSGLSPSRLPMGLPPGAPAPRIGIAAARVQLEAGRPYAFAVEYAADAPGFWIFGEAMLRVGWQTPQGAINPTIAEAAALAQRSDAAVVVVRTFEMEENDRPSIGLPNEQDALIRAVAAVNPRTVVVLMNAGPVEVASWEENVPAIVEAWFAGQEQGRAVARVLFGDVNPAGRLPISFPRRDDQTPLALPAGYPGVDGVLRYDEGIGVGYRGYEQAGVEPQYPFGCGLSYTSFAYENLRIAAEPDGAPVVQVEFDLANTGKRAGTEIAQVYVAGPATGGLKRLAGWARVTLEPGERRTVCVTLDPQSHEQPFSRWNGAQGSWSIMGGEYAIVVGASARDERLQGTAPLPA